MIDNWHVKYHLERLESYSGHRWMPAADTLETAVANLNTARTQLAAVKSADRALALTVWTAPVAVGAGVFAGSVELFRTATPVVFLILVGLVAFVSGWLVRVWLNLNLIARAAHQVAHAEVVYQQQLDKAVGS